jgi:hypothetical protein
MEDRVAKLEQRLASIEGKIQRVLNITIGIAIGLVIGAIIFGIISVKEALSMVK